MVENRRQIYGATLVGVVVLSAVSLLPPVRVLDRAEFRHSDTQHYEDVARLTVAGKLPYRDFYLEYPPAAIPIFLAPRVVGGRHYQRDFGVLMWALGAMAIAVMAFVLAATGDSLLRLYGSTTLAGLAPIPLYAVFYGLYDVWPALIALTALVAVLSGRPRLAAGAAGLGTAAKIYPFLLLPLILLYRRHPNRREVRDGLAAFALPLVLSALPFVLLHPPFGGLAETAREQLRRPLQIESLGGSILLVADRLGLYHAHVHMSFGSQNLAGGLAAAVGVLQGLLEAAAVIAVWLLFARGPHGPRELGTAAATAIVAFATFGKVLSPQYLIWLVFAVPLAARRAWVPAVVVAAAALVLTRLYFPVRYQEVIDVGGLSWLVLVRNLTLVLLFLVLLAAMRRDRPRPGTFTQ